MGPFEVDLWRFRPAETDIIPFPRDVEEAARISVAERRLEAARRRSLLRRVLADATGADADGILIERSAAGKPRVEGCEFSLSHSGPWLVIAVGSCALGVDIETRMPRLSVIELARRFFSEEDAAAVNGAATAGREFLAQWVAKEAALKAAGVGLAGGLDRARCGRSEGEIREVTWDAERFSVREFLLPDGTPGALAWRYDGRELRMRWRSVAELA
jgi:4'-phosphopantetheinyl transferase